MAAEAAGVPGQHFAMHNTAAGQDFAQSGRRGFWSGQHGIPSGIDAISDAVVDLLSTGAACDGSAIGAVSRPTIARIESRRGMSDNSCTRLRCHRESGERRARQPRPPVRSLESGTHPRELDEADRHNDSGSDDRSYGPKARGCAELRKARRTWRAERKYG